MVNLILGGIGSSEQAHQKDTRLICDEGVDNTTHADFDTFHVFEYKVDGP